MTLDTNVEWLFSQQRFGVHPGLSRVSELLARLGHPEQQFRAVLVGGTNGKGSTAASLEAMLRAGGYRTGLFSSPHLTRLGERFRVSGEELPAEQVHAALLHVRPAAEEVGATFFEIVTTLGCLLFAEAGVDLAVMEVGLGGRLDATNVLEPVLSIITNVALDHTAILGDTTAAIAAEKAGILRAGRPAVTAVSPDLLPTLEAQQADLYALNREWRMQVQSLGWEGSALTVEVLGQTLQLQTALLGEHGAQNAALAAVAAWRLGIEEVAIREGAAQTRWPGRMELLPWRGKRLLLDGAHNPAGAEALSRALRLLLAPDGTERVCLVFGAAEDKDLSGVVAALAPLASRVVLTRAVLSPRAADPSSLAALFRRVSPGLPLTVTQSPAEALTALDAGGADELVVVCGSLYLLGELRPLVVGEAAESYERWQ